MTDMRHLSGMRLLACPGKRSLAFHDNLLWTGSLSVPGDMAQMQDFQGDGGVTLDMFSDQVDTLSLFYNWDEQETCRQARALLRGTTLAYIRRAPFPLCTWEEL